ncbi:Def N-formylmethionyl-tRNA deformylase [Rhabdaerophilaceae bacterium]
MSVRKLVYLPDPQLRLISAPVLSVDKALRETITDMFDTMYDAPGIGLAAIQIGVPQRVVTIDVSKRDDTREPMVLINPEIVWESDETSAYEEGCLSIPEYYESVERPAQVRMRYRDIDFREHELEADGIFATCIQHEIDHLDGVLFIDYLSRLKRDRVIKKFTKQARREEGA